MKTPYLILWALLLTSSLESRANHSVHCAIATAERSWHDRQLLGRLARSVNAAVNKKAAEYPWEFELVWLDSIGYLWQEKQTQVYMMVNGDKVSILTPLDGARPAWTPVDFPRNLRMFWFGSLQSRNVLKENREVISQWFTKSIYPILIAHDFEHATHILKTRELSEVEFAHLIRRMSLVSSVDDIPAFVLKYPRKLIKLRVSLPPKENNHHQMFTLSTLARFKSTNGASVLFGEVADANYNVEDIDAPTEGPHVEIAKYRSDSETPLYGNLFSMAPHQALFPKDRMSDLLYGLEDEGDLLLDFYPTVGYFSLTDDSDHHLKQRAIWKRYLEHLIADHGLTPIVEPVR